MENSMFLGEKPNFPVLHDVWEKKKLKLGSILFSFAQSYIIAVNFSNAFNESEKLSAELSDLNKGLDVKVQKRTEQLKKVQEERTLFFSKLSHELKTPLNVILGFSNFIMDSMRSGYVEKDKKNNDKDNHRLSVVEAACEFSSLIVDGKGKSLCSGIELKLRNRFEVTWYAFGHLWVALAGTPWDGFSKSQTSQRKQKEQP